MIRDQKILFNHLFDTLPGSYLILHPHDFSIVEANNAYLELTGTNRDIIGRSLITVFSSIMSKYGIDYTGLRDSLEKVTSTKDKDMMSLHRLNTIHPEGNLFPTFYWNIWHIPVLDKNNHVVNIIQSIEDKTDTILLKQHLKIKDQIAEQQIIDAVSTTRELERMEISRELHDNINQILITSRMYLDRALHNHNSAQELIQSGYKLVDKAIVEIKNISRELMDTSLEKNNLSAEINELLDQVEILGIIEITRQLDIDEDTIHPRIKGVIYRIAQECLANILKHANAGKIELILVSNNETLSLIISDNGTGIKLEEFKSGMGFQNIKTRVAMIDGELKIESNPGKGCRIIVKAPVQD